MSSSPIEHEQAFRAFLARRQEATAAFFNGDAGPWKAQASHTNDITMFGGYGGAEQGWEAVENRYTWAATRDRKSVV